jgi:hypothetical protein
VNPGIAFWDFIALIPLWCQQRTARQRFISSDLRLSHAAAQAGFAVVSPAVTIP